MQEIAVPEIREFSSTQFSYEWFGLGFTGVGLPSLARRARVPADSATLMIDITRLNNHIVRCRNTRTSDIFHLHAHHCSLKNNSVKALYCKGDALLSLKHLVEKQDSKAKGNKGRG